jgi:hypothetical protein
VSKVERLVDGAERKGIALSVPLSAFFLLQSIVIQSSQNYLPFAFLLLSLFFLLISFRRSLGLFMVMFNLLSIFFAYMMIFSVTPIETKYLVNESNSTLVLLRNVTITSYSPQEGGIFVAVFYVLFFFNLALIVYNFAFYYFLKKRREAEKEG